MPQESKKSIRKISCPRNMGEKIIVIGLALIPFIILVFGLITDQSTRKCHRGKDSKDTESTDCSEKLSAQQKAFGLVQLGLLLIMVLIVILLTRFSHLPLASKNLTIKNGTKIHSTHDLEETEEEKSPNPISFESSGPLSALLVSSTNIGRDMDRPRSQSKGESKPTELEMV